jgi:hypothetical protein
MSSGAFTITKYEANNGDIFPIKVQPETLSANLGAVNAAPTGAATVNLYARARKNRRSYGVGARLAYVQFTGAAPDDYAPGQTLAIPVLTPTVFNQITAGTTGTYLGSPIRVVSTSNESRK